MTNFEKLKQAFPDIDPKGHNIKKLCPVPFLGVTFCLRHTMDGKSGLLPREVYDSESPTCTTCTRRYWRFDESDSAYQSVVVHQANPIDVKDVHIYSDAHLVLTMYKEGHYNFEDLTAELNKLGFSVSLKTKSFIEWQKGMED